MFVVHVVSHTIFNAVVYSIKLFAMYVEEFIYPVELVGFVSL